MDVTGVLLAGGQSRRMGRDKASLPVNGIPMAERVLDVLLSLFTQVLISGNRPDLSKPEVPCFPDTYPGSSLGGIYTGLLASRTPWIFVAPCDMPFIDRSLIERLSPLRSGEVDAVIPCSDAGPEPVFGFYRQSCRVLAKDMLTAGQLSVKDFISRLQVRFYQIEASPEARKALFNVNTPSDLVQIKREPA